MRTSCGWEGKGRYGSFQSWINGCVCRQNCEYHRQRVPQLSTSAVRFLHGHYIEYMTSWAIIQDGNTIYTSHSKLLERILRHSLPSTSSCPVSSLDLGRITQPSRPHCGHCRTFDGGDVAASWTCPLHASLYSILCRRLQSSSGLSGSASRLFESYPHSRSLYAYIWRGQMRSAVKHLLCGVPQGSVLGPILFK